MTLATPGVNGTATHVTRPTPDHLLNAPLDALLAEFDVDVAEIEADPGFSGGTFCRPDGSLLFVKPAGRPDAEWELMARAMLGRALRVQLPPLPSLYELTELSAPA
ncbi:hypothetical protein [Streptomyces sp. STCH 565 A]|uniref:hypothetical protein n=1 Tax=Streptomyces sp. STCH 565 A TaxID=2950532 RepID=UPI002075B59D|nr:hypothetical protein [Streptomyces sp. STCH 565 A]MCM8552274.1 hypothetical protein [Streptomyces sp. STCH 565 A]